MWQTTIQMVSDCRNSCRERPALIIGSKDTILSKLFPLRETWLQISYTQSPVQQKNFVESSLADLCSFGDPDPSGADFCYANPDPPLSSYKKKSV